MTTKTDTNNQVIADSITYFAQALDPIHIGTGGERLSRVDMAIVRDPATNVPKLPGTSLSGACRAYAAMHYDKRQCSGWGMNEDTSKRHCGECAICKTFGYANSNDSGSKGKAFFSDAHIIAFPVATAMGPLWIVSQSSLTMVDESIDKEPSDTEIWMEQGSNRIAIGWLALEIKTELKQPEFMKRLEQIDNNKKISMPVGLVSDKLFSHIVNDNLEVRTSVAINPETGAAQDSALFTYEAIPMGTIFALDITYTENKPVGKNPNVIPQDVVWEGLQLFSLLGVGGMATRGMGRMRVIKEVEVQQ